MVSLKDSVTWLKEWREKARTLESKGFILYVPGLPPDQEGGDWKSWGHPDHGDKLFTDDEALATLKPDHDV